MTFICKKYDIKAFPFEEASTLAGTSLEEWAIAHNLTYCNLWMLPQIQAYFGSLKVRKTESGLYDPKALMRDNFSGNNWAIGLWRVCTQLKRSALVKAQINPVMSEYSALAPLVLAGLKKYQNILYSSWSLDGLEHTMDEALYEAITYEPPALSIDRILEIRAQGLTTKSGSKIGEMKKATSTWKLTGIKDTELGQAPSLAVTMLTQIWVAHPSIRSKYMILDPTDWDNTPSPLIEVNVLIPENNIKNEVSEMKMPWE